jgi:CBS domain-containing protein
MEVTMQVSEVMHKGVTTAQIDDSIRRVASLMKKEDIGGMPIYKNQRPVGFVTDRDIVVSCVASGHSPDDPISLAMNREVISVFEDQNVEEATQLMERHQISRLLVVDKGDNPVGMLTLRDLSLSSDNEHLKSELLTEIKRH